MHYALFVSIIANFLRKKISTFLVSYVRIIKQHEKVHCVKEDTVWD